MILRLLAGLSVLLAALGLWLRPAPDWRFAPAERADSALPAEFATVFDYTSPEGTAHAPAIRPTADGFDLVWFDGIRESHNDVRILGTRIGPQGAGVVAPLLTRQSVSRVTVPRQTVLTLGNTIPDGQGGWLATVVSLGGWAAASVAAIDGAGARRLNLSPILNRSHLVKAPVLAMQGGGRLLPTYFEMGAAHGAAALLDDAGRVRGLAQMRGGVRAIQPMIVPLGPQRAVALLRNFDPGTSDLLISHSDDGGRSWSAPAPLDLPNPDAPVAAVLLSDGRILMVFNDAAGRAGALRFAVSADGGHSWERRRVLDGGAMRYPSLRVLSDGRIGLSYSTDGKSRVLAHVLTARWALME